MTGLKLLGLAAGCTVLVLLQTPAALAGATAVVLALYAVARVRPAAAWGQIRPVRWFALALFVTQLLLADLPAATVTTMRVVLMVALAGLVTLTTPASVMLAALERGLAPLRLVRVDPFRVSLMLTLTLRSVPLLTDLARRVREAQRARGVSWSVRAFAVPLVVGALRHADALGEALSARGLDD
ncbi:energy-coupling factor transporter transmembrane component T family protein [Nonomuraea sp. NPDC050547]|uniref:energy-coupling factor transporter transmembrane component T family protein n=1 Tax=unclassified Nonomuraea TaxID=2593643 RepID=UPI003796C5A0